MKFSYSAIAFVLASIATPSTAFTSSSLSSLQSNNRLAPTRLLLVDSSSVGVDISIPYDAPARLAYKEWCDKFDQTPDEQRYQNFKENYETITVANISAKKQARDKSESPPSELTLNEYGDCTEEEYQQLMSSNKSDESPSKSISTGDVLGKAVESAQSQSQASQALAEAADAIAEEEQLLVEKLGLESIDELEAAIDSMQGISDDGIELSDSMAREARIRSAYLDWCKQFSKQPDEDRFPSFSKNFLVMEDFAKESGKEIKLNEYADCTEEEYKAMATKPKAVAPKKSAAPAPAPAPTPASSDIDEAERRRREAETTAKKQAEMQARAEEERKQRREEEVARQKDLEEKRIQLKEWQAKSGEERRAANEKERQRRQKEQEEKLSKQRADQEASVIAAARAQAEKDATLAAQRRAFDEQAAEIARKNAREWDEKQRKLSQTKAKEPAVAKKPSGIFSAFQAPKAESKAAEKAESPKIEFELNLPKIASPAASKSEAKKPLVDLSALNDLIPKEMSTAPTPKPAPQPIVAKKPVAKSTPSKTLTIPFLSSPKPDKKTAKPAESKPVNVPAREIDISDPVTDAFASFFGSKKQAKSQPAKVTPAPSPAPASKKPATPAFSLFSKPAPTKAPAPASTPAPSPAKKMSAPAFSFFSPPAPKDKAPAPAPVPRPAVTKKEAVSPFSFFSPPAPKTAPAPAPKPAPTPSKPSFSLFSAPAPKSKPAPAPAPTPAPKPVFSLFGGQPAAAKSTPTPTSKRTPPKLSNKPGTLSIFGGAPKSQPQTKPAPASARPTIPLFGGGAKAQSRKSAGAPPGVPELSRWKQNANGSITGRIRGSKNFKDGEEVTTSAVARGSKSGTVVKTGSGSRYYLN